MSKILNGDENYFIFDSMPLEVCKMSRCRGSKICTEQDYSSPNKGILYCASQSMLYYGYKLHCKRSLHKLRISPASVHDIHYLEEIKHQMKDCSIIADKGYLSADYQLALFTSSNIN